MKNANKTRCVCETLVHPKWPFFEKCNLDYLTLSLADDLDTHNKRKMKKKKKFTKSNTHLNYERPPLTVPNLYLMF